MAVVRLESISTCVNKPENAVSAFGTLPRAPLPPMAAALR